MVHTDIYESTGYLCGEESSSLGDQDDDPGTIGRNEESTKRAIRKTIPMGRVVQTIDDILRKYPTCPPDAFFHLKEFYSDKKINHYLEDSKQELKWLYVIGVPS